jgi:DNA-binding NarL/FixJ family response regulator
MKKILIVDDNTLFRKTLKECLLTQVPSLIILEAKDGEEALHTISTFFPDFIFMDIMLPKRNGLELTDLIKKEFPDIIIVILTSYDLPEYREAALHSKADHYAPKDSFMPLVNLIFPGGLHRMTFQRNEKFFV